MELENIKWWKKEEEEVRVQLQINADFLLNKVVEIVQGNDGKYYLVRGNSQILITGFLDGQLLAERFAGDEQVLWGLHKREESQEGEYVYSISFRSFYKHSRYAVPKYIYIAPAQLNKFLSQFLPQEDIARYSDEDKLAFIRDKFVGDLVCCFSWVPEKMHKGEWYFWGKGNKAEGEKILHLKKNGKNIWAFVDCRPAGEYEGFKHEDLLLWKYPVEFVLSESDKVAEKEDSFIDFLKDYETLDKEVTATKQQEAGVLKFDRIDYSKFDEGVLTIHIVNMNETQPNLEEFTNRKFWEIWHGETKTLINAAKQIDLPNGYGNIIIEEIENEKPKLQELRDKNIQTGEIKISCLGDDKIHERRAWAFSMFKRRENTKNILCLQSKGLDVANEKGVTDRLKQSFPTITFNEQQKAAIGAAINTPDIAVIWGPPGTGKTTVIKAITERFFEQEKNSRLRNNEKPVLLTSFQNDAVDNLLVSKGTEIPPFRVGKRHDNSLLNKWQESVRNAMKSDQVISDEVRSLLDNLSGWYNSVDQDENSAYELLEKIQKHASFELLSAEIKERIGRLLENRMGSLKKQVLHAQRFDAKSYADDGAVRLQDLVNLVIQGYIQVPNENILPGKEKNTATSKMDLIQYLLNLQKILPADSDGTQFRQFRAVVEILKDFNRETSQGGQLRQCIRDVERDFLVQGSQDPELAKIQMDFMESLNDVDVVQALVSKYTNTIAGTCQGVLETKKPAIGEGLPKNYKMVIVDETPRANPLDLLIPLSMGEKVILVGDFLQLPDFMDEDIKQTLRTTYNKEHNNADLLEKTLFERLYYFLKEHYPEKCVALKAQRRMHPDIGNFVSEQFYKPCGLELTSDEVNRAEKQHNLALYNNQAVAWVNVPRGENEIETRNKGSIFRQIEANKIKDLVAEIVMRNPDKEIGIISFYKGQIEKIQECFAEDEYLKERMEKIKIGTVDSFQGKEFDIVFLSCARSNSQGNIGFLTDMSRLCVAFTRAKQLCVVVGDKATLCPATPTKRNREACKVFQAFFDLCKDKGSVFGAGEENYA